MYIKEKLTIEYTFELTMEEAFIVKQILAKMNPKLLKELDIKFTNGEIDIGKTLYSDFFHCRPLGEYIVYQKKYRER